jgi:pellino protein
MKELTRDMVQATVAFLEQAWPVQRERDPDRLGWDHMFSTSYQIACMALVALGEAEETAWGAVPKAEPRLPEVLPFWEDIAVAVLWLARQQNRLGDRQMDGSVPEPRLAGWGSFIVRRLDAPPPPPANILAGPGSGPARAADVVVAVLEALGLVARGRWTAEAETVLWRGSGHPWGASFEADPRFLAAVEVAAETMPSSVRGEIAALLRVTAADIADGVAQSRAAVEDARARHGPQARIGAPRTEEQVRRGIPFVRAGQLDRIFFRRWRLGRGWLDDTQAGRALEIFHDRLAIAARKAVVARLHPGGFVWEDTSPASQ